MVVGNVGVLVPDLPELITACTKPDAFTSEPPNCWLGPGGWKPLIGKCQMPVVPEPATQGTFWPTQVHVMPPSIVCAP